MRKTAEQIEQHFSLHPSQNTTCTRAQLKAWLLNTAQPYLYNGEGYEIVSKHLGAGVYKVWLRLWRSK